MDQNQFTIDSVKAPESSVFDLSHDLKTSLNMGNLVPVLTQDCLPGDMFKIRPESMFRLAPMLAPIMHKITITIHFFFVPNRILWDQWQNWITENIDVVHPYVALEDSSYDRELVNYLGLPPRTGTTHNISAFPMAAYYKIFDEYYRDQNLVPEKFQPLVAGDNSSSYNVHAPLERRAWMHDYFTSCLPFAQKGDAVTIPIIEGGNIPIVMNPAAATTDQGYWRAYNTNNTQASDGDIVISGGSGVVRGNASALLKFDPQGSLIIEAEQFASTINDLRRAFALQEWLERQARGGTRYIEQIKAHWGITSSDARLQRPEYIGGMKSNMVISEVLQTSGPSLDITTSVGDMYGHGINVSGGDQIKWFCEEHGWIMGLLSIMPDTAYYQGIERKFTKLDVLDYAWPSFAHLGEQAVLNREISTDYPSVENSLETFGYIPRYSEYKFNNSKVTGEFATNLDYWHLARNWQSGGPRLNEDFIACQPTTRVFYVDNLTTDHIYGQIYFNIIASRKLPKFGTPMLIG